VTALWPRQDRTCDTRFRKPLQQESAVLGHGRMPTDLVFCYSTSRDNSRGLATSCGLNAARSASREDRIVDPRECDRAPEKRMGRLFEGEEAVLHLMG
jgi:hypothetical protein